ncbi:MAG: hypothetical protein QM831_28620 [Kofleriaceae bacterium]
MKALLCLLFASTAFADEPHALIVHTPIAHSDVGEPITLVAMVDAPYAEPLAVRWHEIGDARWQEAKFERSSTGAWYATLPPASSPGIEYFIPGHFASEQAPQVVTVEPTLVDRMESIDRSRDGGLTNELSLDVNGHNFGNRYDLDDRYVRGELIYTRRMRRIIDEIGFGFGDVTGRTPEMSDDPNAATPLHGSRYGFGQFRFRLHPSIYVDARAGLAVSQDGFGGTVRGQLTLGKPWRSCVQVGADYLSDLGPTAWVRLQWDTAPPVLMGASVVRTDLPGAVLSRFGVYLAYDISYRLSSRVSIRGQVSYGPRDGSAHVGGGLGTALSF